MTRQSSVQTLSKIVETKLEKIGDLEQEVTSKQRNKLSTSQEEGYLYGYKVGMLSLYRLLLCLNTESEDGTLYLGKIRLMYWVNSAIEWLEFNKKEGFQNVFDFKFTKQNTPQFYKGTASAIEEVKNLCNIFLASEVLAMPDNPPVVTEYNPDLARSYLNRGIKMIVEEKNFLVAIQDFTLAIGHDNTLSLAYNNRAMAYNAVDWIGGFSKALDDANKAIQIDPNYQGSYLQRARAKLGLNDATGAIEDCTFVIGKNSKYHAAYALRGKAKIILNDLVAGIEDCTKAIEGSRAIDLEDGINYFLALDIADAYAYRGLAYNKRDEFDKCLYDFRAAIRLNPNHPAKHRLQTYLNKHSKT